MHVIFLEFCYLCSFQIYFYLLRLNKGYPILYYLIIFLNLFCFIFEIGVINIATFSRAFKEWKFCNYELELLQQKNWMVCPACSQQQHSAHVDGNMKLYRCWQVHMNIFRAM